MTMPDLTRTHFDHFVDQAGGIGRFRDELATGVALQLQPVEASREVAHPDRAVLDRIADPVAREVYRRRIEYLEESGRDSTLPRGMWTEDEEER